ncbi:MAG TPA: hypothetical protein VJZ72_05525 [Candidatus Limnocylindrales bacterium]|nr:hypothetical protein [Candidatus Limnocylindrales bacterium]
MNRSRALLAGPIAAILVAACASSTPSATPGHSAAPSAAPSSSPAASPSAKPIPSPIAIPALDTTFTSKLHGYSVRHPSTWTTESATEVWAPGTSNLWGNPALDTIDGKFVRLVGSSQALADGQSPDDWLASVVGNSPSCVGSSQLPASVTVGGQPATVTLNGCLAAGGGIAPGGVIYDVVAVVDGRGYDFTVDGIVDAAYVQALLAGVTFG